MKQIVVFVFFACTIAQLQAQVPDSVKSYVMSCIEVMKKESLYSNRVNWKKLNKTAKKRLSIAANNREAEAVVIWAFQQLKDEHGSYSGIDTFYRYKKQGPEREFSPGILKEYQKPRDVKTMLLDGEIAYYKMPAVLIGSNTEKMKQWANKLTDSLCKIEALQPKGYIIDLRMNNGGNIEPMWQALEQLIGEQNRTYTADARKNILPDDIDSATVQYKASAIPDRPCTIRKDLPVAVLIGPGTASSGELLTLSFTTRERTRLFGEPTIGVANVTNGFIIQNKGYLLLTVAYVANAQKQVLTQFSIQPDVYIKSDDNYVDPAADVTVQAALTWLHSATR